MLWFPVLNLDIAPSPSRILFANDVLLPIRVQTAVPQAYVSSTQDAMNPEISPVFACDDTLKRFPPTNIMAAGLDPLLDDSIDFHTRLHRHNLSTRLKIWRDLPHGFLVMERTHEAARSAVKMSLDWLRELLWVNND